MGVLVMVLVMEWKLDQYSEGKLGFNLSLRIPKLGLSGIAGVDTESNGINTELLEIDKHLNHDDKNKTKK